jgi:hypothetical protein
VVEGVSTNSEGVKGKPHSRGSQASVAIPLSNLVDWAIISNQPINEMDNGEFVLAADACGFYSHFSLIWRF